jgi:hypothetical protein
MNDEFVPAPFTGRQIRRLIQGSDLFIFQLGTNLLERHSGQPRQETPAILVLAKDGTPLLAA